MELWNSEIGISVKVIFKMFMWKYRFTRIIQEYEEIKEKALAIPADTKEMISLMKFIEEAQTVKLTKLKENIKVFYFEKNTEKHLWSGSPQIKIFVIDWTFSKVASPLKVFQRIFEIDAVKYTFLFFFNAYSMLLICLPSNSLANKFTEAHIRGLCLLRNISFF